MACDSHSTNPSSSMVGTSPLGLSLRYSGVLTTPYCIPASTRSNGTPSSSQHHSTLRTLTELARPQIFSIAFSLETNRLSVAARIARREVAAVELPDHLRAAELVVVVDRDDAVAALLEALQGRRRKAAFDAHVEALHPAKARPVARGLRVLAVIGDAHHDLRVALGLHRPTHDAEAHDRPAALGDESRDDRLVGALARGHAVGMAFLQ